MNVSLVCHPATPGRAVATIDASVSVGRDGSLTVAYALAGDTSRVRIPELRTSSVADELWQHTCFELFARADRSDAYWELKCAPSAQWVLYAFDRDREGMRRVEGALARRIAVRRRDDALELDVTIAASTLGMNPPLSVGVSAVIEETDGTYSYWALVHPADKPDFHHPDALALHLE
jgi:hypothetical protein